MSSHASELDYLDRTFDVGKRLQHDIQRAARNTKVARPDFHLSYFLFSKALKSLGAIRLLWASRFFQDALVLSRSVFEACVSDSFIRTNRANLAHRYLAYDTAARYALSVGMVRSMGRRGGKQLMVWKAGAARYGRAKQKLTYEFGEAQNWSGKTVREMVRIVEKRWRAEGLWTCYEFYYALGSAVAHSSSQSMQEYLRRPHATSYAQYGQRRKYFRDLPFLTCRWCLIAGLSSAQEHFRLDEEFVPSDAIAEAYHLFRSLIVILREDLREFDSETFQ